MIRTRYYTFYTIYIIVLLNIQKNEGWDFIMKAKSLAFRTASFTSILQKIDVKLFNFSIGRCDERTLYVSISISTSQEWVVCDLIYLIDKNDLYGAISLNDKYDYARKFFKKNFDYDLLYSDEQAIAKIISKTSTFKHCLKKYANRYPKYVQSKFFD